jgi:uncharacterized protein (TIRG00374 family)
MCRDVLNGRPAVKSAPHGPASSIPWKRLLQFAVTAALLLFLLSQISLATLVELLGRTNPAGVLAGAALYLAINLARAGRVALICGRPMRQWRSIITPVLATSFGNNVLPARAGEAIFVWAARHRLGMDWGTGAAVIIAMRVFDTLAVAVLFVLMSMLSGIGSSPAILQAVVVLLGAVAVLTALLPWIGQAFVRMAARLARLMRLARAAAFLDSEGARAIEAFAQLRAPRVYAGVFLSSLAIWVITFVWIFLLIRSIGIGVPLSQAVIGSTFGILSKAIPFSSIGGWGAHEAGWSAGFILTGMPAQLAISSGFAVNTLIILTSAACGLPAWFALTHERKHTLAATR